jgi:hypothetical protein
MNQNQIKAIQEKIGTTADGFWGPQSIAAAQKHLRALMPSPNPWPATDQSSLSKFFGAAGDESQLINLNVPGLGVKYDGRAVKTIRCNAKVGASLHRILSALATTHPEFMANYNGCFNNRPMRGGSLPSLHARGAAVDFMAGSNGNHVHWPSKATMPFEVMEAFAKEGWIAAGAFWSRDAMHFQATK